MCLTNGGHSAALNDKAGTLLLSPSPLCSNCSPNEVQLCRPGAAIPFRANRKLSNPQIPRMWRAPAGSLGAMGFVCGGYIISDSEYIIQHNTLCSSDVTPSINQLYGNEEAQVIMELWVTKPYNKHLQWAKFTYNYTYGKMKYTWEKKKPRDHLFAKKCTCNAYGIVGIISKHNDP